MAISAVARIVVLLRREGATEDEIFAYLTDKRRGAALPKNEAITYLVWPEDLAFAQTSAVVEGGGSADQVAISAVFPADLVRDPPQPEPFLLLGCWGWVIVAIVLMVALLLFTDPLMSFICANGWDASNHAACRHVHPFDYQ